MKLRLSALMLMLLFMLCSCKQININYVTNDGGVETLSVYSGVAREGRYEQGKPFVSVEYPKVKIEGEEYSELNTAIEELCGQRKAYQQNTFSEFCEAADYDAKENPERTINYESSERVLVRRADTNAVSLLLECRSYSGGAHGSHTLWGNNYDTTTGKKLELSDVFTDTSDLPELLTQKLLKYFPDAGYFDKPLDLTEYFEKNDHDISWTLDYSGVTFYFNQYDIADYASGAQIVTIAFSEHPKMFFEKYTKIPKAYGVEFPMWTPLFCDIDNDGELNRLMVSGTMDENEAYPCQTVELDGYSIDNDSYAYLVQPIYIHAENGNFIYTENTSDNDWVTLCAFDLAEGKVKGVGNIAGGMHVSFFGDSAMRQALTNPEEFMLDTRTDLLSTISGTKRYCVGASGAPYTQDEFFKFENEIEFTLLKDLSADITDEKGETKGKATLKAGDKVTYSATDNEKTAIVKAGDRMIRLKVNKAWPRRINGLDIETIFDGVMFAG